MGSLILAVVVVLCSAYLLWQFWDGTWADDR